MSEAVAVVLFAGITAYALFGGADFGAGFWDLVAGGAERGERPRAIAQHSIGPVWEANHVWLVFVLVVLWTGFPEAFQSITLRSGGDVTSGNPSMIHARGGDFSTGGFIDIVAAGRVDMGTSLVVTGGDGGVIDISSGGEAVIRGIAAIGGGDAGSGGCASVVAVTLRSCACSLMASLSTPPGAGGKGAGPIGGSCRRGSSRAASRGRPSPGAILPRGGCSPGSTRRPPRRAAPRQRAAPRPAGTGAGPTR